MQNLRELVEETLTPKTKAFDQFGNDRTP